MEIILIRGLPGTGKTTMAQDFSEGCYPLISEHYYLHGKQYLPSYDTFFQRRAVYSLIRTFEAGPPEKIIIEGVLWDPTLIIQFIDGLEEVDDLEIIELDSESMSLDALLARTSLNITKSRIYQLAEDFKKLESATLGSREEKRVALRRVEHLGRSVIPFASLDLTEKRFVKEKMLQSKICRVL